MLLHELLERTGLPERTLRHYTQQGLMPSPVGTDGDHGYGEEHVQRVLAIYRLQREGVRRLAAIAARLDAMTPEQLRRFALEDEEDEEAPLATVASAPAAASAATAPRESWTHIELRAGLVLAVRAGASDEVRALVRSIGTLCGVDASLE